MTSPTPQSHEQFADWLDRSLAGRSTPAADGQPDPDFSAVQESATRFHGLVGQSSQYAVTVQPTPRSWEDLMASASIPYTSPTGPAESLSSGRNHRTSTIRNWDRAASLFMVASILIAVAFGLNRILPNGSNDPPPTDSNSNLGVVPMSTVDPETQLSAYPLVTSADCTQAPMTRDEVIAHLTAANTANDTYYESRYEQAITVSADDEAAVMAAFREWQACQLRGKGSIYSMQLETPWMTAQFERSVRPLDRPASAWEIEQRADALLNDPELDINATPVLAVTSATPETANTGVEEGPSANDPPVTIAPLPVGSTPIAVSLGGSRSFPSMIAGDMRMTGPDRIDAPLYWIDENTREIQFLTPYRVQFIRIDGVWFVNFYGDANRG